MQVEAWDWKQTPIAEHEPAASSSVARHPIDVQIDGPSRENPWELGKEIYYNRARSTSNSKLRGLSNEDNYDNLIRGRPP